MENETYMKRLKDRLQIEFKKQDRSGVYGYTQRSMAYNSNRIEGSTLTEKQRANGYAIGGWRKRANRVSDIQTALPQEVPEKIHQLLEKYHNAEKITLYDIAKFHAQFENIHPFQDGNGRVGRMIILKQCLDHNIVPVIIRDIHKAEYNRYLNKAQHEQDYKGLEAYFEKEQKYYQESTIPMIFDFDEL